MPTYAWLARFRADFDRLTPAQQAVMMTNRLITAQSFCGGG
jgi:hypothetical protein